MPEIEQAIAVPGTPTAAETTAPAPDPQAIAGAVDGVTAPAAETHLDPNPQTTAGDTAAGEADRLLAGASTVADILRLTSQIPAVDAKTSAPADGVTVEPEDTAPLDPTQPLPDRLRTKALTAGQKAMMELAWRNPNATPADLARLTAPPVEPSNTDTSGVVPPAPAASAPPSPAAYVPLVRPARSSADIAAEIDRLGTEQDQALRSADMERAAELNAQVRALNKTLSVTVPAEQRYQRQFAQRVNENQDHMVSLYPDAGKAGSPLYTAMETLLAHYEQGDPTFRQRETWPTVLAIIAAEQLGIKPGSIPRAAAAPAAPIAPVAQPLKPAPVTAPTPRAAVPAATPPAPAAGGARTQAPSPVAAQAAGDQLLASLKSGNDILALTRAF